MRYPPASDDGAYQMSLAAMFRATSDPRYLDRLAWHADGVLALRALRQDSRVDHAH